MSIRSVMLVTNIMPLLSFLDPPSNIFGITAMPNSDDENQHKFGYGGISCDMKRMAKILESLTVGGNTLLITFIRYNPCAFRINGVLQRVLKNDREAELLRVLNDASLPTYDPDRELTVTYMYYDEVDGEPEVVTSDEYHPHIRECVVPWK